MCASYILYIDCNWLCFFCIYSDEEMTKIPETIDDGTDGSDGDPTARLLAILHFPTIVVMIVIPLVVFLILFRDFFTRLCYFMSMVDEDGDDDEVNFQSIRMDTYGEATPSSPSRVQDTTQTSSPVASVGQSDLINIDTNTYLSLVDSFPSLNGSLSDTISKCNIDV